MKSRVLIVEDEPAIIDNIQYVLESEGLETIRSSEGLPILPLLERERVDLILLDIGLPDVNGVDLCREIRKTHAIPVIFLSARNSEIDRVLGLEMGGDDYVSKPFSPRELVARVKAVLRRVTDRAGPMGARGFHEFDVDESRRRISWDGQGLSLSRYEYEILETLIGRPGHVFTREEIMHHVWEEPETSLARSVDAHIKNLRAKLREIHPEQDPIATHRGVGYSFRDDS